MLLRDLYACNPDAALAVSFPEHIPFDPKSLQLFSFRRCPEELHLVPLHYVLKELDLGSELPPVI